MIRCVSSVSKGRSNGISNTMRGPAKHGHKKKKKKKKAKCW